MNRRVMLSMLMFATLMGAMQTEAFADTGRVTVSQVTQAQNTNVAGFYYVEVFYLHYQQKMENGQPVMMNGNPVFEYVAREKHEGLTTVGTLPMGMINYYIHLFNCTDMVVGRRYNFLVCATKVDATTGNRVKDTILITQGDTIATSP